ncbi:MAG: hypothetical protein WD738_19775 [Pirellulales bacterium]
MELLTQSVVSRMTNEAAAQGFDGIADADSQVVQDPRPLLACQLAPLLQPTIFRLVGFDSRLMAQEPEQGKIRVDLAFHHRFEVKLYEGLPGERDVVSQDAELQAVRQECPNVFVALIEKLLHHRVRACRRRPAGSLRATVERQLTANQMNRRVVVATLDCVAPLADDGRLSRHQATVVQFIE